EWGEIWVYESLFTWGFSLNLKTLFKQKNKIVLQSYSIGIKLTTRHLQVQNVWTSVIGRIGRVVNG
ncbi:10287_t:CDS:2, partial [Cetraspora pellucida]